MLVLVAYSSRYHATEQIAERIAETLRVAGLEAETRPAKSAGDLARYDAFIIGSAVYFGSWLKEATAFVRRNQAVLAARPVWLFSSGPIGAETVDEQGHDLREAAVPKAIAELEASIGPRGHRVFFGKLDRDALGLVDRLVASLPAFPGAAGDFRDWADVESWAAGIARELAPAPAAPAATR